MRDLLYLIGGHAELLEPAAPDAHQLGLAAAQHLQIVVLRLEDVRRVELEQQLALLHRLADRPHREGLHPALLAHVDVDETLLVVVDEAEGVDAPRDVAPAGLRRPDAEVVHHLRRDGHRAGRSGGAGIGLDRNQIHAADRALAGLVPHDLRMHGTGVLRLEVRDRVLERGLVPGVLGVPFPRRRRPVVTAEPDADRQGRREREDSPDGLGRAHRTLSVSRMVRPAPPPSMVRGTGVHNRPNRPGSVGLVA
jgi:hypothetical protein